MLWNFTLFKILYMKIYKENMVDLQINLHIFLKERTLNYHNPSKTKAKDNKRNISNYVITDILYI